MLDFGFKMCGDIDTYEIVSLEDAEKDELKLVQADGYLVKVAKVKANTLEDSREMKFTLILDRQGYWVVRYIN